jgi:hypothetical protein
MINPAMMNAVMAGLLSAACLTALADPPRKHSAVSTEETKLSTPSTLSAPAVENDDVVGMSDEEAHTRNSANSIHPEINAQRSIVDEDEAKALRKPSE